MKVCNNNKKNVITIYTLIIHSTFEPTYVKIAYTPSKDSDQPGYLPSLIKVFTVRMKKAWDISYQLGAQQRLISPGRFLG